MMGEGCRPILLRQAVRGRTLMVHQALGVLTLSLQDHITGAYCASVRKERKEENWECTSKADHS
jgi:hypothetical protein